MVTSSGSKTVERRIGGARIAPRTTELPKEIRSIVVQDRPSVLTPFRVPDAWKRKTGRATTMIESFYHAFHGIWTALKEQRNLRLHFLAAFAVLCAGFYFHVDAVSWLALIFAIGLVITAELLNTAVEHLVDLSADGQYRSLARKAKDTAAAAVLIASLTAVGIGCFVFFPKISALLNL
ncbi:MAG TPA: diacylglycerol kinase family protein [Candidatus Obscuribacterales bacterium]